MPDERLGQLLRRIDVSTAPSPTFDDALYRMIEPRALAAGRRDRTWYGRINAAVRSRSIPMILPAPVGSRTLILVAALLVGLLAAAVVTIANLRPDPDQLVRSSEMVYNDPPPFDMTVDYSSGDVRRFRFDGISAVRLDVVAGRYRHLPPGSHVVTDTKLGHHADWDSAGETGSIYELPSGLRPLHEVDMRWGIEFDSWNRQSSEPCGDWVLIGEEIVANLGAWHVRCLDERREEYWIDADSGFILRSTDVPTDDGSAWMTGEVRTLALDVPIDPTVFGVGAEDDSRWGGIMPGGDERLLSGVRAVTSRFNPAFAVTPGDGWRSWGTDVDVVGFVRGPVDEPAGVWIVKLTKVTDVRSGRDVAIAGTGAVLDWLRAHPYFETVRQEQRTIGTIAATSLDLRHVPPEGFETDCPWSPTDPPVPPCRRWFAAGTGYWSYGPPVHDLMQIAVLEVNGATLMVVALVDEPDQEADLAAIDDLLATVEFLD